jgi:FAD/FMN-containing dehydrogenase
LEAIAAIADELSPTFAGRLILPDAAGYDEARQVHNGMIDRRPALVAQCRGAADVADAIKLARRAGLEIAVRGGGHNVGGRATVDGGVVIDLSLMRNVLVDPRSKRAWAGGGALWRDFNRETQLYGLATTGGVVSSTGVAGLTLGGGFGWLMPRFGMALDNLRSVRMVLADGRVVRASDDEHPDLFWAVRGGGGNFGAATTFEFELHDVGPMVVGGLVAHPFSRAKEVLRFFRDQAAKAPDELFLVAALLTAPDGSGTKLAGIAAVHSGSLKDGEAAVTPIKAFASPVMDVLGPMPYTASNMMLDNAFPKGARNYWKSHFLSTLTDDAIDALVDRFADNPSPLCQIALEHFHGAATRVPVEATAYALRDSGFNMLVVSEWIDRAQDDVCIGWCRNVSTAMQPFVSAKRYMNYLGDDDAVASQLAAVYGPNLPRLRQIKKQYDPENVFHLNLNIPPQT